MLVALVAPLLSPPWEVVLPEARAVAVLVPVVALFATLVASFAASRLDRALADRVGRDRRVAAPFAEGPAARAVGEFEDRPVGVGVDRPGPSGPAVGVGAVGLLPRVRLPPQPV